MIKDIYSSFIEQSLLYKITLSIFALLFAKSIFISPFTLTPGIFGVLLGFLLWLLVFIICVILIFFIGKVSWQYKKTTVKSYRLFIYMIPSLVLCFILLGAYFPGIMSFDSIYIWKMTLSGDYTNLHPIAYVLFVELFGKLVNSPWLVITIQFTYASLVFAYIGYTFEKMGLNKKICWLIVLAVSFYPVHFYSNVTMLKDVIYMMSLVMISIQMLIIITEKLTFKNGLILFIVSLLALFSRHNALASVPLSLLAFCIYYLINKNYKLFIKTFTLTIAILVCFFSVNGIIESAFGSNNYWKRSSASDILMMPSAQCSYTIIENLDELTDDQDENARKYFDMGYIFYQIDKYSNWQFNNRYLETLNMEEITKDKNGFVHFYFDCLINYPNDMLLEYQQITAIIWAIPNYGYTLYRNYGIPDYYDSTLIESSPIFPELGKFLDNKINNVFWLRPALWLMLSILLLFSVRKRHRLYAFLITVSMFANTIPFLVGTPAQNVRYFYCNFSIFMILLLVVFMTNSKDQDNSEVVHKL